MELNRKTRRQLRLQSVGFAVLFLAVVGMLAWLSTRYHFQADWTASHRHTLSPASISLLSKLDGPVDITAFAREEGQSTSRSQIQDIVSRYQRKKPDISLKFVNPDLAPDAIRQQGITLEGELVVRYKGRTEHVQKLTEQALTNALQRLARTGRRRLLFLSGHGERQPDGKANYDLSLWVQQLHGQGFGTTVLNLAETPEIPENAAVLVVAGPQVNLLPGEVTLIQKYVAQGGNLLWLADPGDEHGLAPVAQSLGIGFLPGTVVDPTTQMFGIDNAAFAIVTDYPTHPITDNLTSVTLFPKAVGLTVEPAHDWKATRLLRTVRRAWAETGKFSGTVSFDQGADTAGPITIGVALSRSETGEKTKTGHTQRVVVIGDGDFLSNAFLGNGANLQLGTRLVNWLSHDDSLITIPPKVAPDTRLELTKPLSIAIGFGFLVVLPALLLGSGLWVWIRRRKR